MASEAQRLIGISLTKIAQSRAHRSGVSLHKNLLVATVLQKARFIFMEEAYNMVHYHAPAPTHAIKNGAASSNYQDELVGLTAEEAGIESLPETVRETAHLQCVKCSENQDKDNNNQGGGGGGELVYLDLDKTQRERGNSCLKRRCAVTDWETEEAVQSILPKRSRCSSNNTTTTTTTTTTTSSSSSSNNNTEEGDDSVFLDEAAILSDTVSKELETKRNQQQQQQNNNSTLGSSAMEIDRITSLVSIFSFGGGGGGGEGGKITRSVSTPDLCSAQAKDVVGVDVLQQQRPFIAMTV